MSKKEKKSTYNDFGLGDKPLEGYRALNKDGTFNIKKINVPFFDRQNFFHALVTMSWAHFFGVILVVYFSVNFFFAVIYYGIGIEFLTGTSGMSPFEQFMEGFFFSAQTITTLGYGRVAPLGLAANSVAAVESLMGLLFFALATGLLYGRFSKPQSKIKYSNKALIAPYQDINGFMFRITNPQSNQLMEVEVNLSLSIKRPNSNLRDFHNLELERKSVRFFPSIWTIVHPINANSPLFGFNAKDFNDKDVEFICALKAHDEDSGQMMYSRSSYKPNEIVWGEKFVYAAKQENGITYVDLSKLNDSYKANLNT